MFPRNRYDRNWPTGALTKESALGTLRGLAQMDMDLLKPVAALVLDEFEYSTDSVAAAEWSGTGVTVTSEASIVQEGAYSLKCVIDGTGNRTVSKTETWNIEPFATLTFWNRCSATSSAFQFYVKDGSNNESYWDVTSNGSANTWQQDTLDLTTPDSNNGTDADLSDVQEWGFKGLDTSATYYFDTVAVHVAMTVGVIGLDAASYFRHAWLASESPLSIATQAAPTFSAPSSDARISLLTIDDTGTLAWIHGSEASTPTAPNVPANKLPICYVYCKTTMTKVLEYEDKDTDSNQGYLLADVRPFLNLGLGAEILSGNDASKGTSYVGNRFYWATDTYKLHFDTGSAWTDITALFAGFARLTGNQTLSGIKTFDQIIVLPASSPTLDNHGTRKKYVDDQDNLRILAAASFGGDVSGVYSGLTVEKIQGRAVSSSAPSTGQILYWNGSQWALKNAPGGGNFIHFDVTEYLVNDGAYATKLSAKFVKKNGINTLRAKLHKTFGGGSGAYVRLNVDAVNGTPVLISSGSYDTSPPFDNDLITVSVSLSSLTDGSEYTVNLQGQQNGAGGSASFYGAVLYME